MLSIEKPQVGVDEHPKVLPPPRVARLWISGDPKAA
jgi:hypothetical protein